MPTQNTYSGAGPRLTVDMFVNDPLMIQQRMLNMMDQQFIMEGILRPVPNNDSGIVTYWESSPLFLDSEIENVAEGGEIPVGVGSDGLPRAVHTVKTALALELTIEERNRNKIDRFAIRMEQARNTFVRAWNRRLLQALSFNGNIPSVTAANPWVSSSTVRMDIRNAKATVNESTSDYQGDDPIDGDEDFLGFVPDTMVLNTTTADDLTVNDNFTQLYIGGNIAQINPAYTGQLERTVSGLTVLTSRFWPKDQALVLQRNVVGGWSDERPMDWSPSYPDQNREIVARSNGVRQTAIFVDQPKAACWINGVSEA